MVKGLETFRDRFENHANCLTVAEATHIIGLKACAFENLSREKEQGASVDRKKIVKHRNDICRLSQIIDPRPLGDIPDKIRSSILGTIDSIEQKMTDPHNIPNVEATISDIVETLRRVFDSQIRQGER